MCGRTVLEVQDPEGPSTQYLRILVPKAIKGMVFGTRVLKCWVLGPSGGGAAGQGVRRSERNVALRSRSIQR